VSADAGSSAHGESRTSRGRLVAVLLVPAATLVAAALLVLRMHVEPPTVPTYALASATAEEPVQLAPGARFEIEARPTQEVTGAIAARAFLLRGDEVRPWNPVIEVERDGTVRVSGAVEKLFAGVPAGEWEVALAVGRPESLPTAPHDVLRARNPDAGSEAWRLVRRRVVLAVSPAP
jgi:hypothetical protein